MSWCDLAHTGTWKLGVNVDVFTTEGAGKGKLKLMRNREFGPGLKVFSLPQTGTFSLTC